MANINEITVGSEVAVTKEFSEGLKFMHVLATGSESDTFGVVKHVEPTTDEVRLYSELRADADGTDKVIYYDAKANRHFIINAHMIDVVASF